MGVHMKDYSMKISTDKADVEIEPRNDLDTILLSIEDENGMKTMTLNAFQTEKLAAMLNIAAGIARGR
jgi:cytochrome P450